MLRTRLRSIGLFDDSRPVSHGGERHEDGRIKIELPISRICDLHTSTRGGGEGRVGDSIYQPSLNIEHHHRNHIYDHNHNHVLAYL
jgi:hypothetical protein